MESFDERLARKTVNRYVCSACWGELEIVPDLARDSMYFVTCKRCQEDTRGYVTKYYADRRRGESEFQRNEVTRMLQKAGVLPKPDFGTVADIMKSLGF